VHYQRRGGSWLQKRSAPQAESGSSRRGVKLFVEQSLNEPPIVVALDEVSGDKRRILDLNPWLDEYRLGRVEKITWEVDGDLPWFGGLYLPPDYVPGVRYPLLLQTHGFDEKTFSLHGIVRNFPGQAVAAHGIVVLQVAERHGEQQRYLGTAEEWPGVQAGYEAAIDHLDALGIIDRSRVGIQGWSRTGPHVGYTLTHSSYAFAAG